MDHDWRYPLARDNLAEQALQFGTDMETWEVWWRSVDCLCNGFPRYLDRWLAKAFPQFVAEQSVAATVEFNGKKRDTKLKEANFPTDFDSVEYQDVILMLTWK